MEKFEKVYEKAVVKKSKADDKQKRKMLKILKNVKLDSKMKLLV